MGVKSISLLAMVVLVSFCPFFVRAEMVDGLYEGQAIVASQSTQERRETARALLAQVVVKVSGSYAALEHDTVRHALTKAHRYIQQYSYSSKTIEASETVEKIEQPTGESVQSHSSGTLEILNEQNTIEQAPTKTVYELSIKFIPGMVYGLLREAGLPIWPNNRPSVLVWLVVESESGERYFVNDADQSGVYDKLVQAADNRGLPLVTPLLDLQDQMEIDEDDVWGLYHNMIRGASSRYQVDVVLVGRLKQRASGSWHGTWMMLDDDTMVYEGTTDNVDGAMAFAIDRIADGFAKLYAIVPSADGDSTVLMQVDNITNFVDYVGVTSYLGRLAPVRDYVVMAAVGETLFIKLKTEGYFQQLQEAIALDRKFSPVPLTVMAELPPSVTQVWSHRMRYRWIR